MVEIREIKIEFTGNVGFQAYSADPNCVLETLSRDIQNGDWKNYINDPNVRITILKKGQCPEMTHQTAIMNGWKHCPYCGENLTKK